MIDSQKEIQMLKSARRTHLGAWLLTVSVTIAAVMPTSAWALAGGSTGGGGGGGGGGGSSSSGGSGSGSECNSTACDVFAFMIVAIVIGAFLIAWLAAKYVRLRRQMRVQAVERQLGFADAGDAYWNPAKLKERIRECFFPIQQSWENREVESSRPYVSDALYQRHELQLEGLEKQGRVNRIQDLELGGIELVRVHNVTDDGEDRFVARVECSARDWVEDIKTGKLVNGNKQASTNFVQFWSFARHPQYGWVLDEIQQESEGTYHVKATLVNEDGGPSWYETQPAWGQAPPPPAGPTGRPGAAPAGGS
jgi:hypothetical protein